MIETERSLIDTLYRSGELKEDARRRIEHELDLREARLASLRAGNSPRQITARRELAPAWVSYPSSSVNGVPSKHSSPRPMFAIASFIRPRRPSASSPSATKRGLGVAVGEAARMARAMANSSREGLSAQAAM